MRVPVTVKVVFIKQSKQERVCSSSLARFSTLQGIDSSVEARKNHLVIQQQFLKHKILTIYISILNDGVHRNATTFNDNPGGTLHSQNKVRRVKISSTRY